ncbi:DNA primase [Paraprevotella clara]|uniref:DNA primase n=2 Tax=Paraprevotella clara TaxID=454154 RepID=A0A6N3DJL7_9BACT
MTIQEVKTIQISDFLADKGYEPINKKGYKWWYLSPLHTEQTASFKVDLNKNLWYDFGLGKGGNIIDLAMTLFHTQNISEVLHRMDHSIIIPTSPVKLVSSSETTPFKDIEVKELAHPALLNYLLSRGIDSVMTKSQCLEIHYKSCGKNYFAIGFRNDAGGYELRNPYFKGCIAPKAITTIINHEAKCHVFEGFIDYLSYLTLYGKCDAVVLNSIVNIPHALFVLNGYSDIYCYLDNDKAGQMGTQQIVTALGDRCTDAAKEYDGYKDLNEYLMSKLT